MQVCYWIVGIDTQWPFVAIDLHKDNGELVGETYIRSLPRSHPMTAARAIAHAYARERGITRVTYDDDSTEHMRGV